MIAAALVTFALLGDLVTASGHGEVNPLADSIIDQPLLALAAKLAEIALVISVFTIIRPKRPRLAQTVVVLAIAAGALGTWSNL